MNLIQTVAPTKEPITLEQAKDFMHIIENDEDTLIESMIVAAREYAENYINRQLEVATFELINETIYCGFELPKSPVKSVTKIEYMDEDGNYQTMSTDDYYVYVDYGISKLHINQMPTHKQDKRAFKITFVSGYDVIPASIIAHMKMSISTMYENREQYLIGASIEVNANPLLDKMLDMYRVRPI